MKKILAIVLCSLVVGMTASVADMQVYVLDESNLCWKYNAGDEQWHEVLWYGIYPRYFTDLDHDGEGLWAVDGSGNICKYSHINGTVSDVYKYVVYQASGYHFQEVATGNGMVFVIDDQGGYARVLYANSAGYGWRQFYGLPLPSWSGGGKPIAIDVDDWGVPFVLLDNGYIIFYWWWWGGNWYYYDTHSNAARISVRGNLNSDWWLTTVSSQGIMDTKPPNSVWEGHIYCSHAHPDVDSDQTDARFWITSSNPNYQAARYDAITSWLTDLTPPQAEHEYGKCADSPFRSIRITGYQD